MSDKYYIASCSCGKDSLAMVLRLIKEGKPLNEILFYDTGMEFNAIYRIWDRLRRVAEGVGIKCTLLTPKCKFAWTMVEKPVNVGKPNEHKGYAWCGGRCRWGTTEKLEALDKYCEELNAFCYVGIAADEEERLRKEHKEYKLYPLESWGMTELDCLAYCRESGWSREEYTDKTESKSIDLYDILDRVSCYCCGNKNLWELRNIWYYLPRYWNRLCALQWIIPRPFKKNLTVFDLGEKFKNGYKPKHIIRRKKYEQKRS